MLTYTKITCDDFELDIVSGDAHIRDFDVNCLKLTGMGLQTDDDLSVMHILRGIQTKTCHQFPECQKSRVEKMAAKGWNILAPDGSKMW